jgi:hypothetical protein
MGASHLRGCSASNGMGASHLRGCSASNEQVFDLVARGRYPLNALFLLDGPSSS